MTPTVVLCAWFGLCGLQELELPDRDDAPKRHCAGGAYVGPGWRELYCWSWEYDDPSEAALP